MKLLGVGKLLYAAAEDKLTAGESLFESLQKFTSEHLTQHSNRKEEVRPVCAFPRRPILCETAGGDDAMKMRMVKQVLSPGVKNAEESDLCTEVFGIGRYFQQRF